MTDTAEFDTAQPHPVSVRARKSPLLESMLTEISEYVTAVATAERANEMLKTLASDRVDKVVPLPKTPEAITDEWLAEEVRRRVFGTDTDIKLKVLRETHFHAVQKSRSVIESHSKGLIEQLDGHFQKLVAEVQVIADKLGDAATAVDAINADVADHWKSLIEHRARYNSLRDIQRALYRCDSFNIDAAACGDQNQRVTDLEARLYFHRNLATVAPNWRGDINADRQETYGSVPWPSDPVEQLLWFVRNDSGIWCPTGQQIRALLEQQEASQLSHRGTGPAPRIGERDAWTTPRPAFPFTN
ncbi:hypothetical protein [Mycobacteroides abscessus]|uniref:hypothetical protein n=1 Tax=Mycobacteroides abscessus TaxID=36809 RepID=UPI00092BCBAF|nr:hypothetical protein [Mycobacteroides abscessus]SIM22121.1 Uncharacterised protein [Mycobacteroides abscessus subsp. abscessus]